MTWRRNYIRWGFFSPMVLKIAQVEAFRQNSGGNQVTSLNTSSNSTNSSQPHLQRYYPKRVWHHPKTFPSGPSIFVISANTHLHEAHSAHHLDALVSDRPCCFLSQKKKKMKKQDLSKQRRLIRVNHSHCLTEAKILLMAASIWNSWAPLSMFPLIM